MEKTKTHNGVECVWINENTWCAKYLLDLERKNRNKAERDFFFKYINDKLNDFKEKDIFDRLKWAWIKVGNTSKMCWVDNETMKAYKADGYEKTYIEIKKFTFERWCTSFDI